MTEFEAAVIAELKWMRQALERVADLFAATGDGDAGENACTHPADKRIAMSETAFKCSDCNQVVVTT